MFDVQCNHQQKTNAYYSKRIAAASSMQDSRTFTHGHLSTATTLFVSGGHFIHSLIFQPLYNGHL